MVYQILEPQGMLCLLFFLLIDTNQIQKKKQWLIIRVKVANISWYLLVKHYPAPLQKHFNLFYGK